MTSIAEKIIERCGGVASTAKLCRRTESWVRKWTYPKERNGRGGLVPHDDATRLLIEAPKVGIDLTPADFFDLSDDRQGDTS